MANLQEQRRRQAAPPKPTKLSPLVAKKTRQAAGWRGLSVDLITNPQDHPLNADTGRENGGISREAISDEGSGVTALDGKLDGYIIKLIWRSSKLDREKLLAIWWAPAAFNRCGGHL
jgi:hypothetical protein